MYHYVLLMYVNHNTLQYTLLYNVTFCHVAISNYSKEN